MPELARRSPLVVSWSSPHVIVSRPGARSGRPVIWTGGWPRSLTISQYLDEQMRGLPRTVHALAATGRTVILTATGSCWGTLTDYPDTGAAGRAAIDSAITLAGTLGLDTTTVDLVGVSHGGLVSMNWAWRNKAQLHRLWLWSPAWDLDHGYDQDSTAIAWGMPPLSESMRGITGTADKTACMAALADYDPHRNLDDLATIAARTAVVVAGDDELVGIDSLTADCASLGLDLTVVASGGHLFPELASDWSDLFALRWLSA